MCTPRRTIRSPFFPRCDTGGGWVLLLLVILLFPSTGHAQVEKAGEHVRRLIEEGHYTMAEQLLRRQLAQRETPATQYLLGVVLLRQYRYAEAAPFLQAATTAQPRRHRWLHTRAVSLLEQGQCRAAIDLLDRCLTLAPLTQYRYDKAMCALNTGDLATAADALRLVTQEAPRHVHAFYKLGKLLVDRGEHVTAAPLLQHAVSLQPTHLEARFALGLVESRMEHPHAAITSFRAVLATVPGHAGALYNLGRVLISQGQREERQQVLRDFQRGSQQDEQIQHYQQYLHLHPTHLEVRLALGRLLLDTGNSEAAILVTVPLVMLLALLMLLPSQDRRGTPPPDQESDLLFADVTTAAGIDFHHIHGGSGQRYLPETMGAGGCVLDFDRDGWMDLYLLQSGPLPGYHGPSGGTNRLFRNNGDGTFEDVTTRSGSGAAGYGQGAIAADYDGDGDTDLYVTNFGPNVLLRNNGDGTFTDATAAAGLTDTTGKGLGVVVLDFDNDTQPDMYVANDSTPNFLYQNRGGGRFEEVGLVRGVAYNEEGKTEAGMGVDAGDVNGDGWLDLFVTNLSMEANALYLGGQDTFRYATRTAGLYGSSLPVLGVIKQ